MEEGSESTRYWCHECSRAVETITESETTIKCSLCNGSFVEEMDSIRTDNHNHNHHHHTGDSDSDRALSLWAPILLGMMSNPRRHRRFRQIESDDNNENNNEGGESELDRELESIMRRRRRSSAIILQLLQGIRAGMITESDNSNSNGTNNNSNGDREDGENNNNRERVILINPFNQTIIVQGGGAGGGGGGNLFGSGALQNHPLGSLGDYFVGPGLELLLQHLNENDPNRYGTPPAQKEAVEAMPTVKIEEDSVQCSVCLEDFEIGNEAKEMPCKHRFHGECIFPWLDLHSSCPVCRYQMPSDESKLEREREHNINGSEPENGNSEDARQLPVTLQWPFNSLFSSTSGAQIMNPTLIISPSDQSESGSGSVSGPRVTEVDEGEGEGESGQREDDH
ncbi:E3 ubiquitin-protein ligase SIRP1-like [Rutidosis leptorrhynchoides]|uniref:E3 ubiquitin-protein ligase SIRP1-like n=1 Tax=Rutidosis leptorrhynchoides TaxID=125765 RepID=UPI003A9934F9